MDQQEAPAESFRLKCWTSPVLPDETTFTVISGLYYHRSDLLAIDIPAFTLSMTSTFRSFRTLLSRPAHGPVHDSSFPLRYA
ncbi:hypothetical protein KCP74_20075 [Salmonella enterica subsp. enterica]|nr:hypothetical protein KCP74_20075 [Salmonella enterica subsp. enterica]